MRRVCVVLLFAAGIALGGQSHPSPAMASPADDAFIAGLDARGLSYPSPEVAIKNAKGVCSRIGSGMDAAAKYLAASTDYSREQMISFGTLAVQTYCPQ
jgi:hypothetical protein